MAGQFRPGEKITIRSIASALNVSITPAREALFGLAADGGLELRADRSVYVPTLDKERIREITKIRLSLEALAAHETARRITPDELNALRHIHTQLVAANRRGDYKSVIRLNWEFHFTLYRAARMPMLLKMIESCWLMSGSYLNIIYPDFGEVDEGIHNHDAILDAATRHDSADLARALRRDIEFAANALVANISSQNTQSKAAQGKAKRRGNGNGQSARQTK